MGGLPEKLNLRLLEPLRELFKDEVRRLGSALGLPAEMVNRHPFPGPGLAVRVLGEVTKERVEIARRADAIFMRRLREAGLYDSAGAGLLRCYCRCGRSASWAIIALMKMLSPCAPLATDDFMTADWCVWTVIFWPM